MLMYLSRWLKPPVFPGNKEKTWRAALLNSGNLLALLMFSMILIGNLVSGSSNTIMIFLDVLTIGFILLLRFFLFRGKIELSGILTIILGVSLVAFGQALLGTVRTPTTAMLMLLIMVAGQLFGRIGFALSTVSSSLVVLGLILAENASLLPEPDYVVNITQWISYTFIFFLTAVLTHYSFHKTASTLKTTIAEGEELHKTQTLLKQTQKLAKLGGWRWDIKAQKMFWTDETYQIHGIDPADIEAGAEEHIESGIRCYDEKDRPIIEEAFQKCAKDGIAYDIEVPFTTLKGKRLWVRTVAHAEEENGEVVRVIGNIMDITERKQAEELLATHKLRLEYILYGTNVGTWEWNVQTGTTTFNERWASIIGYTLDELAPVTIDTWTKLTHPDDLKRSGEVLEKHFNDEVDYYECEARMRHKNGSWVWVLDRGKVAKWTEDHKPLLMAGTHMDITERKQAEERRLSLETQLRQAQKLEAIGTMVGGISHEFNNVLQSMFLHAGLVQDELPENEELRASFQHILDDGNRARDLIKQVLTFSRKAKVEMEPQPIHDMIMDVLVLERASLPANIDIQQDIDMNCGPVLCDKTQIHQIIMNLCNNARHALEEKGGNLTVSLKPTQASLSEGDPEIDTLELKVSDTGHGIDAADLERIFDPFFTTKQFGKGTGLGLSVVHGIVEMMGGHISVTSEIGKGTTFKILFPMTDAVEEAELAKSSAVPKPMSHRSILLVDDEDSIREAVKTILTNIGFDVDSAPDGHQALELFKANNGKYDLIVTDQSMPKMSGVELTQAIRNTNPEIPIILSTGHLGVEEEQGFIDIGITAFIQKPWTAAELIERIQELDVK